MIKLSNLRTEKVSDQIRLVCDFTWEGDIHNPFTENTIWFSVEKENADFFSTRVYDSFLPVTYYVAMRYGQDLKICGNVSPKLYHNLVNYVQRIYLDFSDLLIPVSLEVEGFDKSEIDGNLVGAGISCGVDSLSTLYDHFVKEKVSEYKINALFFFNAGTHGFWGDSNTNVLARARFNANKPVAQELEIPIYKVESNIHFFAEVVGQNRLGYLANWSCAISVQRRLRRYYVASCLSYEEMISYHKIYRDMDIDEFCGMYLVPRIQTDALELIYDGGQHRRSDKVMNISDWEIAQKYLNVCLTEKETAENCTLCEKCLRTCFVLDVIGKLNRFERVFDLKKYRRVRFKNLCSTVYLKNKSAYAKDNVELAKKYHFRLPPVWIAYIYMTLHIILGGIKVLIKRIIGAERAKQIKQRIGRNRLC